jgi:hypothetical protein
LCRARASENEEYRRELSGGLMWLDGTCADRYGKPFLECAADEQKRMLDEIAFGGEGVGVAFFVFLRDLAPDGLLHEPHRNRVSGISRQRSSPRVQRLPL